LSSASGAGETTRHNWLGKIAGLLIALGMIFGGIWWWWWSWTRDSRGPVLPASGLAEWIIYPKPPDTNPHYLLPFPAVFRRTWTSASAPALATLNIRVFRQGAVQINGRVVDEIALGEKDWKKIRTCEVQKYLRLGENEIVVTVTNAAGPPALWLDLQADGAAL